MKIWISSDDLFTSYAYELVSQLTALDFEAAVDETGNIEESATNALIYLSAHADDRNTTSRRHVAVEGYETLLERTLRALPLHFEQLPLLVEGESKIVRSWTDKVVVMQFKPTVYSYTMNRYGVVSGTDESRIKFTAELFRKMAQIVSSNGVVLQNAFLAEIPSPDGLLLVQKKIEPSNLEVRVKRYHIGSPLHRYRYTEHYASTQTCGPLKRWSRLDEPVVCFDWRNPLQDDEGNRLADEPISDDYASVWMYNVAHAKELARQTFLWMEELFASAGIKLIDMCLIIDREGKMIYGEISPDSMRVRMSLDDPASSEAAAKDVWRAGGSGDALRKNYDKIYARVFGQ